MYLKIDNLILRYLNIWMITLCFLLAFRAIRNIKSTSNFFKISDFGFEENSTFDIKFSEIESENLLFCNFDDFEFQSHPFNHFPISTICAENSNFPKMKMKINKNAENEITTKNFLNFTGMISNKGVYYQVIVNCDDAETTLISTVLTVNQVFHNPSSHLDSRWRGIFTSKTIIISLSIVLLIIWLINWGLASLPSSRLQLTLTCIFFLQIVYQSVRTMELHKLDEDDWDEGFTLIRILFDTAHTMSLCYVVLMVSKGWCMIRKEVPFDENIVAFVFLIVYLAINFVISLFDVRNFELAALMIALLSFFYYVKEILQSVNETRLSITSKLISLLNSGMELKESPIFKQRQIVIALEIAVSASTFALTVNGVVGIFINIPYMVNETIRDTITLAFLILLAFLFKVKPEKLTNYAVVSTSSFDSSDLEELRSGNENLGFSIGQDATEPSEVIDAESNIDVQ